MKKYDIFLFDADGTLYNYDKAEEYALKAMFDYCGFMYDKTIRAKYREINSQVWHDYENGKITMDDMKVVRFERLFEHIGVQYNSKAFSTQYLAELGKGIFLVEGALEICKKIVSMGKQIYIVTNGMFTTQESRIKRSLLKDYISNFFVSEFVGYQKPDIKYFEYVFSHIPKIPKDKILIIGDSLSADIAGGNKAGIDSCWFNEQGMANDTGIMPTYEIRKLEELLQAI